MGEYYLIADIIALNGEDGFVTVNSVSDNPMRLKELDKVYIHIFGSYKEFFPESFRNSRNYLCVKFKNISNSSDAGILVGKKIYVDENNLSGLLDNTYYIHDLINSHVYRNDRLLGVIKDVWTLPANDVYVIEDMQKKELLIPAIKDFVESFNSKEKILVLKPGNEIYDDNAD